jgi:hypothetical protein
MLRARPGGATVLLYSSWLRVSMLAIGFATGQTPWVESGESNETEVSEAQLISGAKRSMCVA